MKKNYKIFTINPGSTTTKIALFEGKNMVFEKNVNHDARKLAEFSHISEQRVYRKEMILSILKENAISLDGLDAVVGRGGGLLALPGGTYQIDETILDHARKGQNGVTHPAQLGSQLAEEFRLEYGGQGFIVNPPDVDEYHDLARMTGLKDIHRSSHIHSLNQKETAIRHAATLGKAYEDCNFIVCHIGGGVSIAAHRKGQMIDGTDTVEGEGPMAPTRMGAVPASPLIRMCYSGKYTEKEMLGLCTRGGGFVSHLGTSDALVVSTKAKEGDPKARIVWRTMIYQITKAVGSMSAVLKGDVDGILLGGGIVYNDELVQLIQEACSFIAPVSAYPGEFEMEAMASGAERVLSGKEEALIYSGKPSWDGFGFEGESHD